MRRIGRWMLNALTALSLLLCVGTCVLWASDYVIYERPGPPLGASAVMHNRLILRSAEIFPVESTFGTPGLIEYRLSFAPVAISMWLPLFRAAGALTRKWKGRSRREGRCPNCSYNLTGNVIGVCPECGRKI